MPKTIAERLTDAVESRLFVRAERCTGFAIPRHGRHPLITHWHGGDRAAIHKAILATIRKELSR